MGKPDEMAMCGLINWAIFGSRRQPVIRPITGGGFRPMRRVLWQNGRLMERYANLIQILDSYLAAVTCKVYNQLNYGGVRDSGLFGAPVLWVGIKSVRC